MIDPGGDTRGLIISLVVVAFMILVDSTAGRLECLPGVSAL